MNLENKLFKLTDEGFEVKFSKPYKCNLLFCDIEKNAVARTISFGKNLINNKPEEVARKIQVTANDIDSYINNTIAKQKSL